MECLTKRLAFEANAHEEAGRISPANLLERLSEEIERRRLGALLSHLPHSDPFDRICRGG